MRGLSADRLQPPDTTTPHLRSNSGDLVAPNLAVQRINHKKIKGLVNQVNVRID